jgi:hypothetical protein
MRARLPVAGRVTAVAARLPQPVLGAAALVGLEAVALVVAGVAYLVATLGGHPNDRSSALVGAVVVLALGVGVGALARGILRCRRWARTPTLLVQFFAGVIVVYQATTLPVLSVPLAVVAVGVVALLLAPAVRRAFGD